MINVLVASLQEILKAQQDHLTGNADAEDVVDAKKRFSLALNEYIDYRINIAFEYRRKKQSQEMIATADSINAGVKSMAGVVKSISALNAAPSPPTNLSDLDGMEKWRKAYAEWYETQRKSGMSIG